MSRTSWQRKLLVLFVGLVLVVSLVPGGAMAQTGVGGTTIVESGQTVSEINGIHGTIIVEGTVTGDVSGVAGSIIVREGGVVEGNLDGAAGTIRISGTVEGSLSAGAGSVHITETGVVEGNVDTGAADVQIDGTIHGDARIGADTIRLGEEASIAGSLTYDGTLEGNTGAVAGEITRDRTLGPSIFSDVQPFAEWAFAFSAFVFNLLLGVLLIGLFPRFSNRVAERVGTEPVKASLVGFGTLLVTPVVLVLVAITVIGIPISIAGLLLFLVTVWIGLVYGRFAVGVWLLSLVDVENVWAALVVGLLAAIVLHQIPVVGGLLNFVIVLLGLGALVLGLVERRRGTTTEPDVETESTGEPEGTAETA